VIMRRHDLLRLILWVPSAALLLVLAFVLLPRSPQAEAAPVRPAPASTQEQELERQFERFALNALLVPLLDDSDDPPRWGDPTLGMECGEGTRVEVDGHRLDTGAPVPEGPFSVQWQLDACLPFGLGGPELSGRADLDVSREREALSATVRLTDLRVQQRGLTFVMNKTFAGRTP
jgi:hypothetical protein